MKMALQPILCFQNTLTMEDIEVRQEGEKRVRSGSTSGISGHYEGVLDQYQCDCVQQP